MEREEENRSRLMPRETELNLDECENERERVTDITKEAGKESERARDREV